jgi:hypothetical protein
MKAKTAADKASVSREARRAACVVLEVLGGERTAGEAAEALAMSTSAYYLLEQRALDALVVACEPRPPGWVATAQWELGGLRKKYAMLERECARYQALARLAQRTMGLAAPKKEERKNKRRPTRRALSAAKRMSKAADAMPETADETPPEEGGEPCPQDDR